jgi:hypothetical protein
MTSKKRSAAVALGRRGGKDLTAKERSERARNAALCRWNSHNVEKEALRRDPQDPLFARLLKVYGGRPMD